MGLNVVARTFQERGIEPPGENEVTLGQFKNRFVYARKGDPSVQDEFKRQGGIIFKKGCITQNIIDLDFVTPPKKNTTIPVINTHESSVSEDKNKINIIYKLFVLIFSQVVVDFLGGITFYGICEIIFTKSKAEELDKKYKEIKSLVLKRTKFYEILEFITNFTDRIYDERIRERLEGIFRKADTPEFQTNCEGESNGESMGIIRWNPIKTLVAVVEAAKHGKESEISIYDLQKEEFVITGLKVLGSVVDVCWQPNTDYSLAVCGEFGCDILLFENVGKNGIKYIESKRLFMTNGEKPKSISSIAFSPLGDKIYCGMKNEGIIIICDTATFSVTYLECSTNIFSKTANKLKGVRNLFMSPDGSCLISTHHNNQLRLWNLYSYESQYLDCFTRPVSSLCWLEYDSHRLAFFTLLGSNQLYALRMSSQFFDAVKVCELLPFDYDQNSSCSIRSIAVNPQSNRLVVSFDNPDNPDNQPSLNLLYVYSIFPQVLFVAGNSRVVLDPIGYVVSPTTNSSAVSSFSFCNQFEYGSLLAVFYSSTSTLHFFPFLSIPYNPYGNLLASTSPLLSKYNDFTLNLRELPTRGKSTSAIPRTPLCYSAFSAPSPTSFTPQSSVSSEFLADSSISASAMKRSIQLLDDLSKSSPKS